jgi:hypothetical protein
LRRAAAAGLLTVTALLTLSSCTATPPIGVLKEGDTISVVVGYQCSGRKSNVNHVRVENYDRGKHKLVEPTLWEIQLDAAHIDKATPLPKVALGDVPDGFIEVANDIPAQGIGATLDVKVWVGDNKYPYVEVFDTDKLKDRKVLDADWNIVSEKQFMDRYGCP